MANERKIIVEVNDQRLSDSNLTFDSDGSVVGNVTPTSEIGQFGIRQATRGISSQLMIAGVVAGLTIQATNYALNNVGAYTGDYVMQNDINNLRKAVGMVINPTGVLYEQMTRNNSISKANLKAQELREITNTSASQVLRGRGRGI
jgi:hypothetical protein